MHGWFCISIPADAKMFFWSEDFLFVTIGLIRVQSCLSTNEDFEYFLLLWVQLKLLKRLEMLKNYKALPRFILVQKDQLFWHLLHLQSPWWSLTQPVWIQCLSRLSTEFLVWILRWYQYLLVHSVWRHLPWSSHEVFLLTPPFQHG